MAEAPAIEANGPLPLLFCTIKPTLHRYFFRHIFVSFDIIRKSDNDEKRTTPDISENRGLFPTEDVVKSFFLRLKPFFNLIRNHIQKDRLNDGTAVLSG